MARAIEIVYLAGPVIAQFMTVLVGRSQLRLSRMLWTWGQANADAQQRCEDWNELHREARHEARKLIRHTVGLAHMCLFRWRSSRSLRKRGYEELAQGWLELTEKFPEWGFTPEALVEMGDLLRRLDGGGTGIGGWLTGAKARAHRSQLETALAIIQLQTKAHREVDRQYFRTPEAQPAPKPTSRMPRRWFRRAA